MGYAISWLAARGTSEAAILSVLELEKTGESEEIPESDWCSTQIGEWVLIWSNSCQPKRFADAADLLTGTVVRCDVEEHVMFCSAAAFLNGSLKWRVEHDAQESADHLVIEGSPPASLPAIQAEESAHSKEDSEVDFVFEIPVRLAQEAVGFRHDVDSKATFDVLRPATKEKSGWRFWQRKS